MRFREKVQKLSWEIRGDIIETFEIKNELEAQAKVLVELGDSL